MRRQGPERLPPTQPRPPNAAEPCDLSQPYIARTTAGLAVPPSATELRKSPVSRPLGCFDPAEQRPDAGGKSLVPVVGSRTARRMLTSNQHLLAPTERSGDLAAVSRCQLR